MNPTLLHLYGPISIQLYGICIATGILIALFLAHRSKFVAQRLPKHLILPLINTCIIAGIIGGRALFLLEEWKNIHSWLTIFAVWDGGFSVLGSILIIIPALLWFVHHYKLSLLKALDVAGLYAPLVQGFGRIGCFFSGCCYGCPSSYWWSITYNFPYSSAPCSVPLHPVQLYSTAALFFLFGIQLFSTRFKVPYGIQFTWGLSGLCLVRFISDFWRGDRGSLIYVGPYGLSSAQILSLILLGMSLSATLGIFIAAQRKRPIS